MSTSSQTLPTSDLRSPAIDTKRHAARKHKPTAYQPPTTHADPRPRYKSAFQISQTRSQANSKYNSHGALAATGVVGSVNKMARKHDKLESCCSSSSEAAVEEESASSSSSDDNVSGQSDAGVAYSFDAAKGPSQGSQILNVALARAVERFEEKETVKLVRNEYDVLDSEGESVGFVPGKKGKGRVVGERAAAGVPDADDDYEFV